MSHDRFNVYKTTQYGGFLTKEAVSSIKETSNSRNLADHRGRQEQEQEGVRQIQEEVQFHEVVHPLLQRRSSQQSDNQRVHHQSFCVDRRERVRQLQCRRIGGQRLYGQPEQVLDHQNDVQPTVQLGEGD